MLNTSNRKIKQCSNVKSEVNGNERNNKPQLGNRVIELCHEHPKENERDVNSQDHPQQIKNQSSCTSRALGLTSFMNSEEQGNGSNDASAKVNRLSDSKNVPQLCMDSSEDYGSASDSDSEHERAGNLSDVFSNLPEDECNISLGQSLTLPKRVVGRYSHSEAQFSKWSGSSPDRRTQFYPYKDWLGHRGSLRKPYRPNTAKSSYQVLSDSLSKLYRMDDFNIQETLGTGFFSTVYKVIHTVSGETMVIKHNTMQSNRPNTLKEVQLMNKLSHPNIAKYLGVCVNEGQLHAVIEYISGGTYHELLLDKKELPWSERAHIVTGIAKGMQYLHARGFLHRDLTSKNILLREDPSNSVVYSAVVADFGLAVKIPDPLRDKSLPPAGTVYWMAPECIHGEFYDEKADLFSFGILLCQTMARIDADPEELPRIDKTFGVNMKELDAMIPRDCPRQLFTLASRCCSVQPKERPSFTCMEPQLTRLYSQLTSDPAAVLCIAWGQTELRETSPADLHSAAASQAAVAARDRHYAALNAELRHRRSRSDDVAEAPQESNPFLFLLGEQCTDKVVNSWGEVGYYWAEPSTPPATPATPTPGFDSAQADFMDCGLRRCCSLPERLNDLSETTPSHLLAQSPTIRTYSRTISDDRPSFDSDGFESDAGLDLSGSFRWTGQRIIDCRRQLSVDCRRMGEASVTDPQLLSSLSPTSATSDLGNSWGYESSNSSDQTTPPQSLSAKARRASAAAQAAVCLVEGVYQARRGKVWELKDRYETWMGNRNKARSPRVAISLGLLRRGQLVRQKLPNYQLESPTNDLKRGSLN